MPFAKALAKVAPDAGAGLAPQGRVTGRYLFNAIY